MTKRNITIALVTNSTWNVYNYRRPLIRRLRAEGFRVLVIAPVDEYIHYLNEGPGVEHIPLRQLSPKSRNPGQDLRLCTELYRLYRRERPALILHFTVKPNIWGNLAARMAGIPSIGIITGLGFPFLHGGIVRRIVSSLYRLALQHPGSVLFFNPSDRQLFVDEQLVDAGKTKVIPGSGVDTKFFQPSSPPTKKPGTVFLFLGRLLYDKGLREFAAAANQIRRRHPSTECWIVGELHAQNPAAVREAELLQWMHAGSIRYFGAARDVRPFLRRADALVLPSYREGLSRALLEAMAMALPVITTDVPGCREAVEDDYNGYLIPARDTKALTETMQHFLESSNAERHRLGSNGRRLAKEKFEGRIVLDAYLKAITEILQTTTVL